jgi:hypothetical protein
LIYPFFILVPAGKFFGSGSGVYPIMGFGLSLLFPGKNALYLGSDPGGYSFAYMSICLLVVLSVAAGKL